MKVVTMIVKARAAHEAIEETGPDVYVANVKSTPERGRATKDALKLLARHLRVPFSKLLLTSRDGLAQKTVCIVD